MLQITQVRSGVGRKFKHRRTLEALGFKTQCGSSGRGVGHEQLANLLAGAGESRLHGAEGESQALGDLTVIELVELPKAEHRSLVHGKLFDGVSKRGLQFAEGEVLLGPW